MTAATALRVGVAAVIALLAAPVVRGQVDGATIRSADIDIQRYRPPGDGIGFLHTSTAAVLGPWEPSGGLSVSYALNPFLHRELRTCGAEEEDCDRRRRVLAPADPLRIVDHQLSMELQGGIGVPLPGPLALTLALNLPVSYVVGGPTTDGSDSTPRLDRMGLGDLRLSPKLTVLNPDRFGLGAAVLLPVSIPTGTRDSFTSDGGVVLAPQVVLGIDANGLRSSVNLGARLRLRRAPVEIYGQRVGSELTYSWGLGVRVHHRVEVLADLFGSLGGSAGNNPVEALVGARVEVWRNLRLDGALGTRLGLGYGSPSLRWVVGATYNLGPVRDSDRDGIIDTQDLCPQHPEDADGWRDGDGCPDLDNDWDGHLDHDDDCPGREEVYNGVDDDDGCPDGDLDGDGIEDRSDRCPESPELANGVLDEDGCPEADSDGDGRVDPVDDCPQEAETFNGVDDDDGCPEADLDADGILDPDDGCPEEPETYNGLRDTDGCPEGDLDGDGIVDELDRCRRRREIVNGFEDEDGCPEPDRDGDGLMSGYDRCPEVPETWNGVLDDDGCPERDIDRDGIVDAVDECVIDREIVNGVEDGDGCPEGDSYGDGVLDPEDRCPSEPETLNGLDEADGCPDQNHVEIRRLHGRATEIRLLNAVTFATAKATLAPPTQSVLDDLIAALLQHPEIRRAEVQAHTDSFGRAEANLRLSHAQAQSVVDYLVAGGVSASRLSARGYGENHLLVPEGSRREQAPNRRVTVVVTEASNPPENAGR
jgi:outer membrane protein OmpA-like peptidoglycan-associated protein